MEIKNNSKVEIFMLKGRTAGSLGQLIDKISDRVDP